MDMELDAGVRILFDVFHTSCWAVLYILILTTDTSFKI